MVEQITEPGTGIEFQKEHDGLKLAGCGYRVKFGIVKVYAVGTYVDISSLSLTKDKDSIQTALLDPKSFPRTLRYVMNRNIPVSKFSVAIVDALKPKMNGSDLDKLDEFTKLCGTKDLKKSAEIYLKIDQDGCTMTFQNAEGSEGTIVSEVFCRALCEVYFGDDNVSPGHKDDVIKGILTM